MISEGQIEMAHALLQCTAYKNHIQAVKTRTDTLIELDDDFSDNERVTYSMFEDQSLCVYPRAII